MLESIQLLAVQAQAQAEASAGEGFFIANWHKLVENLTNKHFFDAMLNPYTIILCLVILGLGIMWKSRKIYIALIAMWGYSLIYRFTIETRGAGDVMFDYKTMQVNELGPLVTFFVGFIVVTAVILYLGFLKGD